MIKESYSRVATGILAVAVIILFVLHFTGKGDEQPGQEQALPGMLAGDSGSVKIAYVFVDSVLANYEYYKVLTDRLVSSKNSLEKELANKGESFQKEVNEFQYKVERKLITSWDAEARQKQLAEQQQVLVNLQNDMQGRLAQEEQSVTVQLHDSVISAVNDVNRKLGYNLVLSSSFGGGLLYAENYMNITRQVLDRLNDTYRKSLSR